MDIETLDGKHAAYDANEWADLDALYHGGKLFKARIARFLPQNPQEPSNLYQQRQTEAYYRSYLGPIVDYYTAWLFSAAIEVTAKDSDTDKPAVLDPWYADFKEDVGADVDLADFVRERFTAALIGECSHWIVQMPSDGGKAPADKAEFRQRNLGSATLVKVDREDLYDWECDDEGRLAWAIVHSSKVVRPSPMAKRDTVIETWKVYDQTTVETFTSTYKVGQRPPAGQVASIEKRAHGCKQVPLVTLAVPPGLCLGARLQAAQIEHFRLSCALAWAIRRTCYAMPVFAVKDKSNPPTVMGSGYYLMIEVGEEQSWSAPPSEPFEVIAKQVETQREEIYRMSAQMALSVNNQSASAVRRSGESKEQDSLSTRVMLSAYASSVKEAIELTYEIVSDARGDTNVCFSIGGLDDFDTAGPTELLTNAGLAEGLSIPSVTFQKEMKKRCAFALLSDADQTTKQQISDEIDAGVDAQVDLADAMRENMKKGDMDETPDEPADDSEGDAGDGKPVPTAAAA